MSTAIVIFLLVFSGVTVSFLLGTLYERQRCKKLWRTHADIIRTQAHTIQSQRKIIAGLNEQLKRS